MNFKEKKKKLFELYDSFEKASRPYLQSAVCKIGCADCCITVGNVDASTLEGMCIFEHMKSFPPSLQKEINKGLKKNKQLREKSTYAPCAFLMKDKTCSIYAVRPFSCRRLYSIKICGETGPTLHRPIWQLAGEVEKAIQLLDDNGYSGHLSYIFQLLKDSQFRETYLRGDFSPNDIREFALSHNIVLNRSVAVNDQKSGVLSFNP
jgi:hypothetical protein